MNIASTNIDFTHRAYTLFVSGCKVKCKGCHNPDIQDFNIGTPLHKAIGTIQKELVATSPMLKHVWVMGGEPLNQEKEQLKELLRQLRGYNLNVWLFTSFQYHEIPEDIREVVDVCKCGHYAINAPPVSYTVRGTTLELASSNQYIVDTVSGKLDPST